MVSLLLSLACAPAIVIAIPPPPPLQENRTRANTKQRYHILRAWHFSHRKQWKEARQSFEEAAKYAPNDPWIYVHWGDAARMLNKEEETVEAWSTALSLFSMKQTKERTLIHQRLRMYP